jgi:hypothetical protein
VASVFVDELLNRKQLWTLSILAVNLLEGFATISRRMLKGEIVVRKPAVVVFVKFVAAEVVQKYERGQRACSAHSRF